MIITQTPLRISFLGGNTDFSDYYEKFGGCVLTTAIDKYVYCIITPRFDDKIYVNWSKKEIVDKVSDIEHDLVREALIKVGVKSGIEITFLADIPTEGSGLGSSSSVTVGVLNALYQYTGQPVSSDILARQAVDIEINRLKKPIGIQDQYAVAFGGLRLFEFQKNGTVTNRKIAISNGKREDLDNSLMLFFTQKTRKSSDILQTVKKNISQKTALLHKTKQLAYDGVTCLESGNAHNLGKLLHEYWLLKKQISDNISTQSIDSMYELAISAGATGGKITGAGGGGFLLLMVPYDKRENVRRALSQYQELPFRLGVDGSRVIFNIQRP